MEMDTQMEEDRHTGKPLGFAGSERTLSLCSNRIFLIPFHSFPSGFFYILMRNPG